jgi:hypothetical protein
MKLITILILLFASLNSFGQGIESLLKCINHNKELSIIEQKGIFEYISSEPQKGYYKSKFIGKSRFDVECLQYSNGNKKNALVVNSKKIFLEEKLDPLTLKFYLIVYNNKTFLCFFGESESASGTGAQRTFYIFISVIGDEIKRAYFFDTRFGSIENIGNFDGSCKLQYFKLSYDDAMNRYIGRIYPIFKDVTVDSTKFVKLTRNNNDEFFLNSYNWFRDSTCFKSLEPFKTR